MSLNSSTGQAARLGSLLHETNGGVLQVGEVLVVGVVEGEDAAHRQHQHQQHAEPFTYDNHPPHAGHAFRTLV
ncbi:hypothetical protein E2C01_002242 [Portunus trituberculatus]|uniref:Uncharacterized protein n=1 Tax=Portunus trituberculatus TaxID=210409 RepID=A0A5B7CMR8_PORTR|nr:hypothetical protein [Portunus trituberculatus]